MRALAWEILQHVEAGAFADALLGPRTTPGWNDVIKPC
jgi:hypothetical protein